MRTVKTIPVNLAERSYQIFIGEGILASAGKIWKKAGLPGRAIILTTPRLHALYGEIFQSSLEQAGIQTVLLTIEDGEKFKNLTTVSGIYDILVQLKVERGDCLVALGGGVLGDMAGFAAATYLRGLNFVQVPTTLLAQVDSSIGGKTGVNHPEGKNLIGAFFQPKMILTDVLPLATLPDAEIRSGLAEVVKYGVISDENFFEFLESSAPYLAGRPDLKNKKVREIYLKIVTTCAGIKASVVARDEKEKNLRMILNFGHTIGHGIETAGHFRKYAHGQAVALGMLGAARLAVDMKICPSTVFRRLKNILKTFGLPVSIKGLDGQKIFSALLLDKKFKDRKLRLVLPTKIGRVAVYPDIKPARVKKVISGLMENKEK